MFKKIISISIFSVIIQLFGMFSGVLVARMLGVEGRGELAVIMIWPTIIATIGLSGIDISLARKSSLFERLDSSLYRLALFFSVVLGVFFIALGYLVLPYILSESKLYLLNAANVALLFVPSSILTVYLYSISLGRGNIGQYNYIRFIFSPLYILSLSAVLIAGEVTVTNVVYSFVLASTITGIIAITYLYKNSNGVMGESIDKIELLRNSLPFGASASIYSLSTHLPSILLAGLVDVNIVGLFVVAYVVSTIHMPFGNAIGKVLFSDIVQVGSNNKTILNKFRLTLLIYVLITIVSYFVLPFILKILYGDDFMTAESMLVFLIPITSILAVTGIVDDILKGHGVSKPGIISRVIGLFVLLVFGWLSINEFGVIGLLYSLLLKSILEFIVISIGFASFYRVSFLSLFVFKVNDIFYLKKIIMNYRI